MIRKRAIPLILILALCLSLSAAGVSGALTASPVRVRPGEQFTVDVQLQNPGVVGMRVFVEYDNALLRLDKAENGEIFDAGNATFGREISANPYKMLWDDSLRHDNITQSGTLAVLTFTVLSDVPGTQTEIRLHADPGSSFDVDLNAVPVAEGVCAVTIEQDEPAVAEPALRVAEPTVKTLNYGHTLTLHAETDNLPQGAEVRWSIEGTGLRAVGNTTGFFFTVECVGSSGATVTAGLYAADGTAWTDASGVPITASRTIRTNASLWRRIVYLIEVLLHIGIYHPQSA